MAVQIFKDGDSMYFDMDKLGAKNLQNHIDAGWSFDNVVKTLEADAESEDKTAEDIRDEAEKAGIEGFATKRISTLKKELGYE